MANTDTARIIAYLNSHSVSSGPTCRGVTPNGRLVVVSAYTDANGGSGEQTETIPATMRAAREWLGY